MRVAFLLACFSAILADAGEPKIPSFRAVQIDDQVEIGYGLAVADVDGDRKQDILLVDKREVVWYRNPDWTRHVMTGQLTERDHVCIAAADIDGDGKAEVAVGAQWNPGDTQNSGAVFYLIPPADRTQKWTPVQLHHEPTVHRMRWVKNDRGEYDLVVVPLHGRGNKNGEGAGVRILAYHKPANPRDAWRTTLIDDSLHKTHNFDLVQWDRAKGDELLVAAAEGVFLLLRNLDGYQRVQLAGNRPGETDHPGAGEVRNGRLPNGQRFIATIEPMHGNRVAVYTQGKGQEFWNRQVIDDSLVDGHAVACGDLLKAGHDQIVVGWRAMGQPNARVGIRMYVPDGTGQQWKAHQIDDNTMACEDLMLADFNGDGRLDIVAAGRATKNVKIYFNEGAGEAVRR